MLALTPALALLLVQPPPAPEDTYEPNPAWKALGPAIWFDPKERTLILRGRVCLREGALEHLLCKSRTKEHESILATDAPPKLIHAGLLLTGAEVGHPVRFVPKFVPPAGTPIKIELEWTQDGKAHKANARDWIANSAKKPLAMDWVFAGSNTYTDPETKKTYYGADDGDIVTVANFETSLLDIPTESTASDADRNYQANTEKIPPLGTFVTIRLRPALPEKAKGEAPPAATPARPAGGARSAS